MLNPSVFRIRYFGATNNRGARVTIIDWRFHKSIMLDYNYEARDKLEQAKDYLNKRGIICAGAGELSKEEDIIISNNFETPLK